MKLFLKCFNPGDISLVVKFLCFYNDCFICSPVTRKLHIISLRNCTKAFEYIRPNFYILPLMQIDFSKFT